MESWSTCIECRWCGECCFECCGNWVRHSPCSGVRLQALTIDLDSANAFALFLKSQRKWSSPPLANESISLFKSRLKEYDYATKFILPHGSYLINLGNPDMCATVFCHAYVHFTYASFTNLLVQSAKNLTNVSSMT